MKEIKFRQAIADEEKFYWHYWGYLHTDIAGLPVFINPLGSVEWDKRPSCQFTGLKDKNGKEIYKGDIVRRRTTHTQPVLVVEWGQVGWNPFENDLCDLSNVACYEIIGNIHDNPELLEKPK